MFRMIVSIVAGNSLHLSILCTSAVCRVTGNARFRSLSFVTASFPCFGCILRPARSNASMLQTLRAHPGRAEATTVTVTVVPPDTLQHVVRDDHDRLRCQLDVGGAAMRVGRGRGK